jgi:hypothetical protein
MVLPLCLRGMAKQWYHAQSRHTLDRLNASIDEWERLFVSEFRASLVDRETTADRRRWMIGKESSKAYFYDKLELLRDYLPESSPEDLQFILQKIKDGMDAEYAINIRSTLFPNPSINKFLHELDEVDRMVDAKLARERADRRPTHQPVSQTRETAKTTSRAPHRPGDSQPTAPRPSDPAASLRFSYDPSRISFDTSIRPAVRLYTRPDTNRVLRLERPCRACGQQHFGFEHDHITKKVHWTTHEDDVNWTEQEDNQNPSPFDDSSSDSDMQGFA